MQEICDPAEPSSILGVNIRFTTIRPVPASTCRCVTSHPRGVELSVRCTKPSVDVCSQDVLRMTVPGS